MFTNLQAQADSGVRGDPITGGDEDMDFNGQILANYGDEEILAAMTDKI